MKKTLSVLTLTILLALSGCQDKQESQAEHDAKVAAQAKAELRAELRKAEEERAKAQEKESKLAHIGITTTDGKLIIDTNKTKSYFQKLAEKLKTHADKFAKELESGDINNSEAGIIVTETKINIDINKTKSFLETWEQTIEQYAKEFKKMTEELNSSK